MAGASAGPAVIYLSPHADDVAFSCGGSVAADRAEGAEVMLITVFSECAGGPQRKAEDRAAAAALGAELVPLELPDALDRPEVRGSLDLFAPLAPRHLGILGEVVSRLAQRVPAGAAVRAPLGVGGHIDHRLVCAAARALAGMRPLALGFYEDQPYSLARFSLGRRMAALGARVAGEAPGLGRAGPADEVRAYHAYLAGLPMGQAMGVPGLRWLLLRLAARAGVRADRLGHRPGPPPRLRPVLREVGAHAAARLAGIGAYASQWPLFFPSPEAFAAALLAHGRSLSPKGGCWERLWVEEEDPSASASTSASTSTPT